MHRNADRDRDDNALLDVENSCLSRVARKLFFAGLLGLSGGTYAAAVYSKPLGASCWSGFHGCIILMGYFAMFQEAARFVRGAADPINSWIGGTAAGYILSASQHSAESCHLDGHRSGIRTGLWGGIATGSFHYAKDHFPIGTVRGILESWDLLDAPDPPSHLKDNGVEEVEEEWVSPWWEAYMPFRRISKQEAMRQKAMEAEMYQSMIDQMAPPQTRTSEIQKLLSTDDNTSAKNSENQHQ